MTWPKTERYHHRRWSRVVGTVEQRHEKRRSKRGALGRRMLGMTGYHIAPHPDHNYELESLSLEAKIDQLRQELDD